MIRNYLKKSYRRTMDMSYRLAFDKISESLNEGGSCLDCGANNGENYYKLCNSLNVVDISYQGIEWNSDCVINAQEKGLNVNQGDLNFSLPFKDSYFDCIFALSVVEHLLNPCFFIREAKRCLKHNGRLVILTPNISTYFTAFRILSGKMPSSGPHPDSEALIKSDNIFSSDSSLKLGSNFTKMDVESDTPVHRHLIVFSYLSLKKYLKIAGFRNIEGYGFGLYPFPNFMQPLLEKIDPYHCHQMVFIAEK